MPGMFESRAIASNVPMTMPPAVAIKVNMMVKRMPSKNRYGSERMITFQSILENIVPPSVCRCRLAHADEAGHCNAPLEPAHAVHDNDVDNDVDRGGASEGFEDLKGKFGHRPCGRGELDEPDGQRHRGILDDVEKF